MAITTRTTFLVASALSLGGVLSAASWIRTVSPEPLPKPRTEEQRPSSIAMRAAENSLRQLRGESPLIEPERKPDAITGLLSRFSPIQSTKPIHEQILAEFKEFVRTCQLAKADEVVTTKRLLYLTKAAEARGRVFTPKDTDGTNDQTSRAAVRLWKWNFTSTMPMTDVTNLFVRGFTNEAFTNSEMRLALDEQLAPPARRC